MPDQQCCVLASTSKFVKEHPDEVAKIVKVDVESLRYILDHQDEALKIISKFSNIPQETLEAAVFNMIYPWPPRVNGTTSKNLLRGLMAAGIVNESAIKPDVDTWWSKLNDDSFEKQLEADGYIAKLAKESVKP